MPELSPPYVQPELTGAHQLADPRAMPLADHVEQVMQLLQSGDHPRGRDEEVYASPNPA